ncbi:hypothetical protein EVAR_81328_1 [Eumeta japonica]|uniref:Uncharacterized protein n=1 Tax=Eumeta variegata TaxID=151549 RepID=A0A4C1W1I6_EUMVA|nr:hypothetical protein EVAR_81328_1 [Eumeta japonica]
MKFHIKLFKYNQKKVTALRTDKPSIWLRRRFPKQLSVAKKALYKNCPASETAATCRICFTVKLNGRRFCLSIFEMQRSFARENPINPIKTHAQASHHRLGGHRRSWTHARPEIVRRFERRHWVKVALTKAPHSLTKDASQFARFQHNKRANPFLWLSIPIGVKARTHSDSSRTAAGGASLMPKLTLHGPVRPKVNDTAALDTREGPQLNAQWAGVEGLRSMPLDLKKRVLGGYPSTVE